MKCAICQHEKESHRGFTCGHRDCECLCFMDPNFEAPGPLIEAWQEKVLTEVTDMILEEREGDVKVAMNGQTCHVKVVFAPDIGFHVVKGGTS